MTTSKYLNSVLRILPAIQAKQMSELLGELQASGEIISANEYEAKLAELSTLVNSTDPTPSFKQIRALIWHIATAESHNTMMTALKNDIEGLFLQTDEIGQKVNDHHFLFMKNLLADMERGLKDQENTIRRLEWLAGQNNEFSLALVNSFNSSSLLRVPRTELGADTLYFDNRTYQNKTEKELPSAVVSEDAEQLYLDTQNNPMILPLSVRILSDSNSYGTEIKTDVDNNIANIIDGTRGTYWRRDVYLFDKVPNVNTVLEFDLGVAKDCNYVVIQGATESPFFVERIDGIASDGHTINLLSSSITIDGRKRIDFERVFIKSVKITFSVKTYSRAEYYTDKKDTLINVLNPNDKYNKISIARDLGPLAAEVISSKNLSNLLNIPSGISQQINSNLYSFALDNVWFGNSLYNDAGIFVSKPLKGNDFGVIAIQANEDIVAGVVSNSIEYEIIRRDISPQYKEIRFPIPYLNQSSVASERLILTKRETNSTINDAGALRFCPYISPNYNPVDTAPIQVYKNGKALNIGDDFQIAIRNKEALSVTSFDWKDGFTEGSSDARDFNNYKLNPTKMWIKIKDPDSTAVYTVNYDIRTSDTYIDDKTVWLDKDRNVFLSSDGRIHFRRISSDVTIESEIYLQITLRRNVASRSSTPILKEYAILGATYNG